MEPLSTWSQSITGAGKQSSLSWSHSLVLSSKSGQWDRRGSQVRGMWGRTSLLLKRDAEVRHCCFSWLWRLVCGHAMPGAMATILQPRKNCGQAEGMAQQREEQNQGAWGWPGATSQLDSPSWSHPTLGLTFYVRFVSASMVYYLQHETLIA